MSDWKEYTLEELCDFQNGFAFKNSDYVDSSENTNEVFRMGYINRGGGFKEDTTPVFVPQNYPKNLDKFILKLNDITIAMTDMKNSMALLGCCARISHNNRFILNQRVGRIRVVRNDILDPIYLYYYLNSSKQIDYLRANANSGVQVNLSTDTIKKSILKIPSIEKQREIANILFALDQKIELNTQINQTLEQIAQALFKSWFVDFDPMRAKVQALSDGLSLEQAELAAMQAISGKTPEELTALSQTQPDHYAELVETAKAFPCEMVEVDGVGAPKGWEVLNANDVIEFNPKETLKKDTLAYYLDMASLPTQGCSPDLPILRKFTSGTRFRNGDTLFARITPCLENGKTAFIQYLPEGTVAWGSTEYIVMRTKGIIPKPYSYLLARYESFREYAIRSMTGTSGRQRTQLDIIETYKIVSPSDNKLWESFSKIINPIFETINSNTNKNITLSNIRDLLLPKLLNGEI